MFDEIMKTMHAINDPLIERGRFVAPILVQNQFAMQVRDHCIELSTAQDEQKVRQLLAKIDHLVSLYWFSPLMRAWQCHQAAELPYVKNFSHMLERATFHYFRQDYLSAIMVLVPVIEGIILRHSGTSISEFKNWAKLRDFLEKLESEYTQPEMITRFKNYRDFLTKFLHEPFFCRGEKASLSFNDSLLNRNFILQMLGDEPFYNQHDCQTMFQLIDLYMEVIICQKLGTKFHYFIKPEEGDVMTRERHYCSIILQDYLGLGDRQAEETLLKSHELYTAIPRSTNYIEIHDEGRSQLFALTQTLLKAPDFVYKSVLSMPNIEENKQKLLTKACQAVVMTKGLNHNDLLSGVMTAMTR